MRHIEIAFGCKNFRIDANQIAAVLIDQQELEFDRGTTGQHALGIGNACGEQT